MFIYFQRSLFKLLIGFVLVCSLFIACGEKGTQPVARIGGRIITVTEFEDSFSRGKSQKIIVESTLESKLDHLNKMIDKELQIVAAYRANLDQDEEIIKRVEKRGESAIFRRLIDKEVIDPNISQKEIKQFYKKSKKQVKVAEIVLQMNPNAAEQEQKEVNDKLKEIQEKIDSGADFSKLVEKYSQDKNRRVAPHQGQKGLLKWTPFNSDDPVCQKGFTMKVGEVSEPIKTKKGYSIIKVLEIIKPVVKPFSVEKERIKQQVLRKRGKDLEKKYVEFLEKLKKKYAVEYKEENIQKFIDTVAKPARDTTKNRDFRFSTDREKPFKNFSSEDKELIIIKYSDGKISIGDFIEEINKFPITRRPNIANSEEVFNLIDRRILPQKLLELEAEAQDIKNDEKVKEQLTSFSESYMLSKIKQVEIKGKAKATDNDLMKYYEEHRDEFKNQEKREIQEIAVKDESLANELLKRAKSGENFTKLVKKYSEKESSKKKGGNIGLIIRSRQYYGKQAFETEPGGIAGPISIGKFYSIIKVLDVKEATFKTFAESKKLLSAKVNREFKNQREKDWMEELKNEIEITIFENRLKNSFSYYKEIKPE